MTVSRHLTRQTSSDSSHHGQKAIPPAHHFSASPELLGFGRGAYQRRSEQTSRLLGQLFDRLRGEGLTVTYTMEDFNRQYTKEHFSRLTTDERREALALLTPQQRREVLRSLPPEERREFLRSLPPDELLEQLLAVLSADQIRQRLEELSASRQAPRRKARRKRQRRVDGAAG